MKSRSVDECVLYFLSFAFVKLATVDHTLIRDVEDLEARTVPGSRFPVHENEIKQVRRTVDALAQRGDEGRDKLR